MANFYPEIRAVQQREGASILLLPVAKQIHLSFFIARTKL